MRTSKRPNNCVICHVKLKSFRHEKIGKLHASRGRCEVCCARERWANNPEYRKKHKEWTYNWKDKYPARWKKNVAKAVAKYSKTPRGKLAMSIVSFKRKYGKTWKEAFKEKSKWYKLAVELGRI